MATEGALRALMDDLRPLSRQAPEVLWRMRLAEIGLPALLSLVSLVLLRYYRLSERPRSDHADP
jgi:Na+/melibiose symporter-like transporter